MGKITFQAALGGSVDLVGPNTATAVTLNLPAASGSIVGTGSTGVVTTAMISGQIAVAQGGTGVSTSTGTGSVVLNTSPTLVTPNLGTPASGVLSNATGLPLTTGVTGILPVANGGSGTATPALVAGTNVSITGTWPNQTINSTASGSGSVTSVATGTGLTGGPITTTGTISLANTAVTPGTYTAANITIDAQGRITAAANGSGGGGGTVTSVGLSAPAFLTVTGSPVTTSGTLALSYSGTALPVANGGTGVTTSSGANSVVLRDSDVNVSSNNFNAGWTSTSLSTTLVSLTNASSYYQEFTGAIIGQVVRLPYGPTAVLGQSYIIINNGSFQLDLRDAANVQIKTLYAGEAVCAVCKGTSTSNNWEVFVLVPTVGPSGSIIWDNVSLQMAGSSLSGVSTFGLSGQLTSTVTTGTAPFVVSSTTPVANLNIGGNAATATTVTGTVAIANGGTGLTTTPANGALDIGNGTGFTRTTLTAGSGVSITNASGSITIAATGSGGTVTSVAATVPAFLSVTGSPITTSGTLAISYSGTALPVANGGTGVTVSSGANSVVLRDANQNISINSISEGYVNVAAAGTTTVLTVASAPNYVVTGSGGQTYQLPDATTLANGINYLFNNNQSSGTIVVKNNSSTTIATIQSGGYVEIILLSNSIAAGTWDVHNQAPSNVAWSTNTFSYPGSITSATWNGNAVGILYGGTGQTTAAAGFNALSPITTTGDLILGNGTNSATRLPIGANGYVLTSNGTTASWTAGGGSGTVTSVAQSFTGGIISVAGSPITTSGTLALTVAGTSGGVPYFDSSTSWASSAAGTAGQVLTSNGTAAPTWTTVGGLGTVTSVDVSGGTTGLTTSGGPITTTGTITLAGTLATSNGGIGTTNGSLANCTVDGTNAVGYLNVPQNAQTGSYTLVLADGGKHIYHASGAAAATYTIPVATSVAYPIGTVISFVNLSVNNVTIAITTDTMYLVGYGSTGSRTLSQYGVATATKVSGTSSAGIWIISGVGLT